MHIALRYRLQQLHFGILLPALLTVLLAAAPTSHAQQTAQGDIVFKGSGKRLSFPPAIFPHWKHRIRYRCSVCHEKIFKMKRGANKTNMKTMEEGKYCGACHNGREAFNIEFANCTKCHMKIGAPKPAAAVEPANVEPTNTEKKAK